MQKIIPFYQPKIKICCIQNTQEAEMAIKAGAWAIGFVSAMPSGPGVISEETIAKIAKVVGARAETVLLTSLTSATEIIAQHNRCKTSAIQLVDKVELLEYSKLRNALPGIKLIQVIHVTGTESIAEALEISAFVDFILLDSGNPALEIKELGGTGRTHNWEISKKIVDTVNIPVFLAGGLNPENVKTAVSNVRPFGIDVCSGLRTDRRLDIDKLNSFFVESKTD
jgi:phosphoribosylanthranilate isomerase